ncbi:MAG: hypothetical protein IPH20_02015 [Bacteroidales bacterium]|nr:hypothetical protein [Bacteroidales bacterium]
MKRTKSNTSVTDKKSEKVILADLTEVKENRLMCVGIGASAGGLEALEVFFRNMPVDSGMAFIVIQHLSPDYKSLMSELLSRYTTMEIFKAEEGMVVDPNSIYLIPPKKI